MKSKADLQKRVYNLERMLRAMILEQLDCMADCKSCNGRGDYHEGHIYEEPCEDCRGLGKIIA